MQSASNEALYTPQDLWHHLFGDEPGLLAIWIKNGDEVQTQYFNYPKSADAAAEWALKKSRAGQEVYFCAHLLTRARRTKEDAAAVHALWADLDGAQVPKGEISPSVVVESSPGKFHCYWRLVDGIPPETAEELNKRLALAIGADPSGSDLTQLLRVPGTVNHKYEGKPVVEVVDVNEVTNVTAGEWDRILPRPTRTPAFDAPGSIEEISDGSRNKTLTSFAGLLRRQGLDEEGLFAAVMGINASKCKPPLPEIEVAQIAHSVARYEPKKSSSLNRSRSRSRIDQDREDRDYRDNVKNPKNSLRAVSFAGEPKPPPRQFVVEGIVPAGVPTIVYGPSGIAKSFNILHLALSVALVGLDTWHGRPIMTCPVIYLDFEMDRIEQLRRAQEVVRGVGWPDVPKNFWYVNALGYPAAEVFDFAAEQLEDLGEALVIVDSFGFALAGESERSADVLTFMREHIGALQAAGGHPLIVDHVARLVRGERAGNQDAFGSIYKKNAARSNIHVTGHQEEGSSQIYTTFTHKSTNVGPIAAPFTVITRFAAGEVAFELSDEVIKPPAPESTADLIVAAIQEYGPMTNKEVAETIDRPYKTVQNVTKELKDAGVLRAMGEKRDGAEVLDRGGVE